MVRNRKVWGVLGLLLALAVVVGVGQQRQPQVPAEILAMQQMQIQVMQQLNQLMTSAAQELKVALPAAPGPQSIIPGMVYATRSGDNIILAGAPAKDLERVTLSDLNQGAILGVVYLQLPSLIPAGFYKLRVVMQAPIRPGAPNAKAQLIDKSEKVVRELPATVEPSERSILGVKLTAELGDGKFCIDFHWDRIGGQFCFE